MKNELYEFMLTNINTQLNSQDPLKPLPGDFSIFTVSETLAMMTMKSKEDVISDILNNQLHL